MLFVYTYLAHPHRQSRIYVYLGLYWFYMFMSPKNYILFEKLRDFICTAFINPCVHTICINISIYFYFILRMCFDTTTSTGITLFLTMKKKSNFPKYDAPTTMRNISVNNLCLKQLSRSYCKKKWCLLNISFFCFDVTLKLLTCIIYIANVWCF